MHPVQDLPELSVVVLGAKVAGWLATEDPSLMQLPSQHGAIHPPGHANLLQSALPQTDVHEMSTATHCSIHCTATHCSIHCTTNNCSIHRTAHMQLTPHFLQDDIMYPMLTVEENLTFSARIRLPADFTHGQHLHFVEQAIQVGPGALAAACLQVGSPLGWYRLGWDSWHRCGLFSAAHTTTCNRVFTNRCCA